MEQNEKKVLAELMQLGYERNVIAFADMKNNEELEGYFDEMSTRVIKASRDWFATEGRQYEEDFVQNTVMRFCLTLGIGAAWFWENRKDDVAAKGLYECMAEPRKEFEMDEYIEDMVGIWWSSKSYEHYMYLRLVDECMYILCKHYELTDKGQEHMAGLVMMHLGMYVGYTRIYHERAIVPYKGKMPWHWELWEHLYGKDDDKLSVYNNWAMKAAREGHKGLDIYVTKKDPDSEFGKTVTCFRHFNYKKDSGLKTLAYMDDEDNFCIENAVPVFDSTRNIFIVIDKVYVWESGAEATIEAHFYDDEGFRFTFYDTDYLENKDRYYEGSYYAFDLYGIAYYVNEVPEDQWSFSLEGEKAVDFNKKIGKETIYDENGVPEPVIINTKSLHTFLQTNDDLPEDASFQAPIKAVYDDIDYLGKKVYKIEIGIPYRDLDHEEREHLFSIYTPAEVDGKPVSRPSVGMPVRGVIYLQGKMRHSVDIQECPSTMLHSFEAINVDGKRVIFTDVCKEGEEGRPMTEEERHEFAKQVFYQQMAERTGIQKYESDKENAPDFLMERRRDVWIKEDENYSASDDFIAEDKVKYLLLACHRNSRPVITYVSLYDTEGNECRWLKGGRYTAVIHYGSVLPGQKMELMRHLDHEKLMKVLCRAFDELDTSIIEPYLHKDLDYRSPALADPMITRDEYLSRTDYVNEKLRNTENGRMKAEIVPDDIGGNMIKLTYPDGHVDAMTAETEAGFIKAIKIENLIRKENL